MIIVFIFFGKMMSVMALKDSLVRILLTACYTFWLYGVANSSDHLKEVIQRTADIKPGAGLQEIHEQVVSHIAMMLPNIFKLLSSKVKSII